MRINPNIGLTYDDVLLVPQYSAVNPSQTDTAIELTKKIKLQIPIMSAAMDTVTEDAMAIGLGRLGGLGVIHRANTIEEQVFLVKKVKQAKVLVGAACGPHDLERAKGLDQAGVDVIAIDCAHAHKPGVIADALIIKKSIKAALMIGNIATAKAAKDLLAVADIIKVGVGPGAICTTRIVAGVGAPQLTAVMDVVKIAKIKNVPVVADGGLKYSGDIVKALAAGARAVMLGSMLAGLEECPGKVILVDDKKYKVYRGMGSKIVMEKNQSADRYFQAGSAKFVPEGVEGVVPYNGRLEDTIFQLVGGLKAGMGYIGAKNILAMPRQAEFVRITSAGLAESHPHSITINKKAPNY